MKSILLVFCLFSVGYVSSQELLRVSEDSLFGYMNVKGQVIIKPQFKWAQEFSEGLAFVRKESLYGIIDETGEFVLEPIFSHAYPFENGVAIVSIDSLYGLIDVQGEFIIEPKYQRLYFQSEGKIGVKLNDLWGFCSIRTGLPITEIKYACIDRFSEGLAAVKEIYPKGYGFIDDKGVVKIPCTLNAVYSTGFKNGLAAVGFSSRENGFITKTGENAFNEHFYSVKGFSEGYGFVKKHYDSLGYFIDTTGARVSNQSFKNCWWFTDGYCGAETDSSYVVLNTKHEIVFESKTIELRFFSNGFGFACDRSGKLTWCLMDTNMRIVSDLRFVKLFGIPNKNAIEFYHGDPSKWYGYSKRGYINKLGEIIWKEE